MQLTRAADYAVRVMIYLASQPEGAVVSKPLLARAAEAPDSFLAKILQSLARSGLVQARRGVDGGFSLTAGGADASLLDVVEAIDGPVALNLCLGAGNACRRSRDCAAHLVWAEAQEAMLAVLRRARIRELAAGIQDASAKSSAPGADSSSVSSASLSSGSVSEQPMLRVQPPTRPHGASSPEDDDCATGEKNR